MGKRREQVGAPRRDCQRIYAVSNRFDIRRKAVADFQWPGSGLQDGHVIVAVQSVKDLQRDALGALHRGLAFGLCSHAGGTIDDQYDIATGTAPTE